jgi:tetratricopeptide (TPR) repeat protein
MIARSRIPMLFATGCLLPVAAIAQVVGLPSTPARGINLYSIWVVAGKVTTLQGDPVSGARVEVVPTSGSAGPRTLMTNLQGEFQTEYSLNTEDVKEFIFVLRVAKKGFRRAHAVIDFTEAGKAWVIPITLREPEEDPELLSQAELISGLAPRLNKLKASDGLSPAGEMDYERGVAEFMEKDSPDRALPFFAKATRRDASCLPCRTMLALAELASGDWDGAYRNLAEVFNKRADRSLARPEPFVALGVMESWRRQPKSAAGYFVEALKYAPQDSLALQELGRSQLLVQNWAAADEYLGKAIAAGAKPEVRLLRVEALLGEDQFQAADTEMTRYLAGRDVKKMPLRVRQLWARVENRKKIEAVYGKAKSNDRELDYLDHPPRDLEGLEPATDQVPLNSILSAVGKTVAESFANFPNTSSLEHIHQEKLQRKQKVATRLDQRFRYLCYTPAHDWGPGFNEYRTDLVGKEVTPHGLEDGFMLTSGFASAALVFHPMYQSQANFRYLGRQKVNGRGTYLVAFAQQPTKARFNGTFKSGTVSMATFTQGLAWIDAQSYQITHLRTDLLKPLQELNLERETTEIAYGEVHFKGLTAGYWVPRQVTVTVDWNGKHLRNEHQYSEFQLFQVQATEKVGKPEKLSQTSK